MNPKPLIRRVFISDLSELIELCILHAEHERLPYANDGQLERLQQALFGAPPVLFGWVATGDNGLDGYMTAVIEFATWPARPMVYMDCLYVRERARRSGVGRAFIEHLTDFAGKREIAEIQWQTPPYNDLGLGFYRRIGATSLPKMRFSLDTTRAAESLRRSGSR